VLFGKIDKDAVLDKITELDTNLSKYKDLVEFFGGELDGNIIRSHALAKRLLKSLLT